MTWRCIVGAGMMLTCLAGQVAARVSDDEDPDLAVATLRVQIEQLQFARAGEIRSLVHDVLLDADSRTSLLQGGPVAGWDSHPFLASRDDSFRLQIAGRLQARYAISLQDGEAVDPGRGGFEIRRVRLTLSGHVVDPTWTYAIQFATSRTTGVFALDDGFIRKDLGDGRWLRFGQFRPGFLHESGVSSGRQQAVERSLLHSTFGVGRSHGIEAGYRGEVFRLAAMFHDGNGLQNTPALVIDTEFAATGRLDVLLAGTWKQLRDFEGWPSSDPAVFIGAAIHYQKGEFGTPAGPEAETLRWTVDGTIKGNGASVYAALMATHTDTTSATELDQYGALLQGGLFVTDDVEVFARYEWGDDDLPGSHLSVLTVGFSRFWSKHNLKWTTDVGYGFNPVGPTFDSGGANWREDAVGEAGQVVVRTQLQLQF